MINQIKEQLEDPFIRKLIRYFLYFVYFVIFIGFYFHDNYFRYLSKLTDSQINEAWEQGRSPYKLNKTYYYFLSLELTYLLVWLRVKHTAYKIFVTCLVFTNLAVVLYLGFTYPHGDVFSPKDNFYIGAGDIYVLLGMIFHFDFLRRIWRRPKNKISQ